MVPYSVVEYYGTLSNFDATGSGIGDWEKIYLCNGLNGTPDKRGVVGVGVTDGTLLGGTMPARTNPTTPGADNPTYVLGTPQGSNNVELDITQIPSHTHTTTVTVTDPGHTHGINTNTSDTGNTNRQVQGGDAEDTGASINQILSATTGITVGVSNAPIGGGLPHLNYQPSLPCYYIQYRP
jgi:microcystin-dependent protein